MAKKFTTDELQKYFSGQLKHACYAKTVELAKRLARHADGKNYGELIETRRPGESKRIKKYRQAIIVEKTKETWSSVITELGKIRKADDWGVRYEVEKFPAKIAKGETLQDYCETKYPNFGSLTNWIFQALLKKYSVDSHCAILNMPLEEVDTVEFRRPYNFLFPAANVYEFSENQYSILLSKKTVEYEEGGTKMKGKVFYVVNTETIERWEQINSKLDFQRASVLEHKFGYLPVRLTKGVVADTEDESSVWESRFMPMAPALDECIREYSDLQAAVVQHLHPEKAVVKNQECSECNGIGKIQGKGGLEPPKSCEKCGGTGWVASGPYKNYMYAPKQLGQADDIKWPPVVYIDKPGVAEIIKLQNERVADHQYQALASINMHFLWKVPINESGVAKAVDQDALNNFVNLVTEDLISIMDWTYKCTNDWRYTFLVESEEDRNSWLPKVPVPTNFNILSSTYYIDEIKKARDGKVNPLLINYLELAYTNKMFNADHSLKDKLSAIIDLDPLSGYSHDDKGAMIMNKGVEDLDYIISCNISAFIRTAIEKDQRFISKTYDEKMAVLRELATAKQESIRAAMEIENPVDGEDSINTEGAPAEGG